MPDSHLLENGPGVLSTLNSVVMMGVSGYGGVAFQIQGTFTGTITFEASVQGSEFEPLRVVATDNSTAVTTTTGTGIYIGSAVGLTTVRARMSAYSNGAASVIIRASVASPGGSGGGGGVGSDVNLIEVGGASIALGQTTMSASLPVTIASDQDPIPVTGSISATNPSVAPTGAAVPSEATYLGVLDPDGNLTGIAAETFDYDTSGATKAQIAFGVAIPSSSGALPVLGGHGTAAQAFRVELPTDGTGVIAGITNAVNVNGTGSAGTASAGVVSIQGITSMTPVLVNQPTGTNLHVAVDSGTITTITNAVKAVGSIADDATTPGDPVMTGGWAKSPDGTTPGNVTAEDDVIRFIGDLNRIQYVNTTDPTKKHLSFTGATAYTQQSIASAPGAGFQIVIKRVRLSSGAAVLQTLKIEDEDDTRLAGPYYLAEIAGAGFMFDCDIPAPANKGIQFTTTEAGDQTAEFEWIVKKV